MPQPIAPPTRITARAGAPAHAHAASARMEPAPFVRKPASNENANERDGNLRRAWSGFCAHFTRSPAPARSAPHAPLPAFAGSYSPTIPHGPGVGAEVPRNANGIPLGVPYQIPHLYGDDLFVHL